MILTSIVRFVLFLLIGFLFVIALKTQAYAPSGSSYTPDRAMFDEGCGRDPKCIEERVKVEIPELYETIRCESRFRQFDDKGNVLQSHTKDMGVGQIHVPIWGEEAKRLGYDIYSFRGNMEMTKYILKVQGKKAWVCYRLLNSV